MVSIKAGLDTLAKESLIFPDHQIHMWVKLNSACEVIFTLQEKLVVAVGTNSNNQLNYFSKSRCN